jgi:signal transduction histidine kinase
MVPGSQNARAIPGNAGIVLGSVLAGSRGSGDGWKTKVKQETAPDRIDAVHPPDAITRSLEMSMRRLVMIMRGLGWFWMLLLVIATLLIDSQANKAIVIAAMALATVWTGVTWWAYKKRSRLGSTWFMIADGVVCLVVASASYAADAGDLFHGGYPISWIAVLAYGGGLRWAVGGSLILAGQQAVLLLDSGRSAVSAIGSIVFLIYGLMLGWLFTVIRTSDRDRRETVAELMAEREENARRLERLELANRLHDSALQTLQVIDTDADDPDRVRSLARRQARDLRDLVERYSEDGCVSFNECLASAIGSIEELFAVKISAVVRIDLPIDAALEALVEASREAMTNSAKYAGTRRIDVYAAIEEGEATVYVRDDGEGFDMGTTDLGHGIERSIRSRLAVVGGSADIVSAPARGTEVVLRVAVEGARV